MQNLRDERLGMTVMQANHMLGTIVEYHDGEHITVKLENGNLIHTKWAYFRDGNIARTSDLSTQDRVGTTIMQNCGMAVTCIAYRTYADCDFKFEDGKIVEHRGWDSFTKGNISYIGKKGYAAVRIGMSKLQYNGQTATVIAYQDADHVTVQFDDGSVLTTKWSLFKSGDIRISRDSKSFSTVGQTKLQQNGVLYRCIGFHSDNNATFRNEETGTTTSQPWEHFEKGTLPSFEKKKPNYIGLSIKQNSGLTATCIRVKDHEHADFQFSDGTVLTRDIGSFIKGTLPDPKALQDRTSRLGRTVRMKNGLDAVCTAYRSATDLDMTFPDQVTVHGTTWIQVQRGTVMHPLFQTWKHADDFYGYDVTLAFKGKNNEVFYKCVNKKTGEKSIQPLGRLIPSANLG